MTFRLAALDSVRCDVLLDATPDAILVMGDQGPILTINTGLGLYLSQRLAPLLDGRINGDGEFGGGTTFTLVMPDPR